MSASSTRPSEPFKHYRFNEAEVPDKPAGLGDD